MSSSLGNGFWEGSRVARRDAVPAVEAIVREETNALLIQREAAWFTRRAG
jgi:hypothetical protein